ncbi:hypothetical protein LTR94_025227 [Friedmanniomyces endolithicus]|nr:hypothetical protein LTR94_025227 [Friedmanniomyces endolithicus]
MTPEKVIRSRSAVALSRLGDLACGFDELTHIAAVDEGGIELNGDARRPLHLLIGDLEHGDVGEGHQTAAMHPASGVHMFLLGAKGAAHRTVWIQLAEKWSDHHVKGVVQIIGLPTGELAFGDSDFLGHVRRGLTYGLAVQHIGAMSDPIETAILNKLAAIGPGKSIEPAEVAKALQPEQWQRMLPKVRAVALSLMRQGRLTITKKGKPVDPDAFRGVTRLRLPTEEETALALSKKPPVSQDESED